jgi:hypothetical protein
MAVSLVVAAVLAPSLARAHPLGFAVVTIDATREREAIVVVRVSGSESDPGDLRLGWPEGCEETVLRDAMHDEVRERRVRVTCTSPLAGSALRIEGPARGVEVMIETTLPGRATSREVVRALPADVRVGTAQSTLDVARGWAALGVEHFAFGLDHVLFVVGAFFLARRRGGRAIALAVTAFTLGHALTLALATLGALTLPSRAVEACIALSLVHVARELAVESDTLTRRAPAVVCALFGLVHGAGFARALDEAGLSRAELGVGLFSFNVGLELAELALVSLLVLLARPALAPRLERLAPLVIGAVGAWLLLDRLAAFA